jgi:hypothetical protein
MAVRNLIFRGLLLLTLLLFAGAAAAQIEVPFRLHSEHRMILVKAKINGKPARLIVDTASASTILSEKALGMSIRTNRPGVYNKRFTLSSEHSAGGQSAVSWKRKMFSTLLFFLRICYTRIPQSAPGD